MRRYSLVAVAAVLVLSACQSASEVLTEQIAEQVEGVDNVEIDTESGEVSIETDEGSISIGGGELPDGFPVPLPDGYEVTTVFTSDQESLVAVTYPPDRYDELASFLNGWTESQPGEWSHTSNTIDTAAGKVIRNEVWHTDDTTLSIVDCQAFSPDGGVADAACVNVQSG